MFSVFSNKLIELRELIEKSKTRSKDVQFFGLKESIVYLRDKPHVNIPYIIVPQIVSETDEAELLYIYATSVELRNIIKWIVTNILFEINRIDTKTLFVKNRIATSMLNKLEGKIDKDWLLVIHLAFIDNLLKVYSDCINEDLPF